MKREYHTNFKLAGLVDNQTYSYTNVQLKATLLATIDYNHGARHYLA